MATTALPSAVSGKDFSYTVCNLLEHRPLYEYRTCADSGYRLSVLLIGSGEKLNILRDKILSHGQLLDTTLEMTIVTEDVAGAWESLAQQAPELGRFIQIKGVSGKVPLCEWNLGTLEYKPLEGTIADILKAHPQCNYVLIGQSVSGADVLVPARDRFIACLEGDHIRTLDAEGTVFGPHPDDSYMQEVMDIAYRIHYAYEKGRDPQMTDGEIRESFLNPYNYASNIDCALHIRSKIMCVVDNPTDLTLAEQFVDALEFDYSINGNLFDKLAQLEHRRWCISKLVKGFRLGTPEECYRLPGDTSHNADEKWHACLVPYHFTRRLQEDDWDSTDSDQDRTLDELDQQTLRIHKRCGEIMENTLESCLALTKELKDALAPELKGYADKLQENIGQIASGDHDILFSYRENIRGLYQSMRLTELHAGSEILEKLTDLMTAPLEYLMRKDYKEVNFDIIRQIVFSARKISTLVKLMPAPDKAWECVASAYQFRPGKVVFLDIAENIKQLETLRDRAKKVNWFLGSLARDTGTVYHVFVPSSIPLSGTFTFRKVPAAGLRKSHPQLFEGWDCRLIPLDLSRTEYLAKHFMHLMNQVRPTAIDVTGGNSRLQPLVSQFADCNPVSAFEIHDNQIHNIRGAQIIDKLMLDTGVSVRELFDLYGTHFIKQDSENVSDTFRRQYASLWNIASGTDAWYWFYLAFSKACNAQPNSKQHREHKQVLKTALEDSIAEIAKRPAHGNPSKEQETLSKLRDILHGLVQQNHLIPDQTGEYLTASCPEVFASLVNPGKALEHYIYCTAQDSGLFDDVVMSWFFKHTDEANSAKNELDILCSRNNTSLFISAKHVGKNTFDAEFLQSTCMQVSWLASHFGGSNPKAILAAPVVAQFTKDGKISPEVRRAADWGVYLLGDACFRGGNLPRVLDNISQGKDDWCDFLLELSRQP